jgi:hypothetical protein
VAGKSAQRQNVMRRGSSLESKAYYFPLLFLFPAFDGDAIESGGYCLSKRKWQTSTFDLATLDSHHMLHLSYQVMDIMLHRCNLELTVPSAASLDEAVSLFQALRLGLYIEGVTPFLSPFVTDYSINEYSGINSRDSGLLDELDPGLREGLRSAETTIEAWPLELSFQCHTLEKRKVTSDVFAKAAKFAATWLRLTKEDKTLSFLGDVATAAPTIAPTGQSILHIWSGIEALFPGVQSELSFRIALYLAQLLRSNENRSEVYDRARGAYKLRSKITHGAHRDASFDDWLESWSLFTSALRAVCDRGNLPEEEDLIKELLS